MFTLHYRRTNGVRRRVLDAQTKAKTSTAHSRAQLLQHRNVLSRNILELRKSQGIFMPGLTPLLGSDENQDDAKLWLPSELSDADRDKWCLPGIPELEVRFRYAQADDSLAKIRRIRRMVQGLLNQNSKHPNPQRTITRTKSVFNRFQARIRRAAMQYRHARSALQTLDPSEQHSPGWTRRFKELEDGDIRGPGREYHELSEGKFQPSWIWLVPHLPKPAEDDGHLSSETNSDSDSDSDSGSGSGSGSDSGSEESEVADDLRVHWAKCQARADRFEEEVMLTVEEMGRTLRYFEWKKSRWLSLQSQREQSTNRPSTEVIQGLRAYAHRQAHIYETLITSFSNHWRGLLTTHGLGLGWLLRYPLAPDPPSAQPSQKDESHIASADSASA